METAIILAWKNKKNKLKYRRNKKCGKICALTFSHNSYS